MNDSSRNNYGGCNKYGSGCGGNNYGSCHENHSTQSKYSGCHCGGNHSTRSNMNNCENRAFENRGNNEPEAYDTHPETYSSCHDN